MNNRNKNIDEILRRKLEGRDFGGPSKYFFNDIDKRLDRYSIYPKKRWGIILWSILIIILWGILLSDNITINSMHVRKNNHLFISKNTVKSKINDDSIIENTNTKKQEIKNRYNSKTKFIDKEGKDKEKQHDDDYFVNKRKREGVISNIRNDRDAIQKHDRLIYGNNIIKDKKRVKKNNNVQYKISKERDVLSVDNVKINDFNSTVSKDSMDANYVMVKTAAIDSLQNLNKTQPSIDKSTILLEKNSTKEISKFMMEVQLTIGGLYSFTNTVTKFGALYEDKLTEDSEMQLSSLFEIRFNCYLHNILVGTGIRYSQYKEDNEYELFGMPMNTDKDVKQKISIISIPLVLGYRFNLKNNWAIIPQLGAQINMPIQTYLMKYPQDNYQELTTYNIANYSINIVGGIEISKGFKKWRVLFRSNYIHGITPLIKKTKFKRFYNHIETALGIGYCF